MKTTFRMLGALVVSVSLGAVGAGVGAQQAAVSAAACTVAALQAKAPAGTTITDAAIVKAEGNLPEYCRVDGHAASPGNEVNFRLGLPAAWNGKFHFTGVGGTGGSIGSLNAGLERGYASASTDTGHVSSDTTWGSNRAKEIDYGHRGTHVTTVATKALTATYYSRQPQYSYFTGCSNGGRQAMMEVQRYPTDYDGIIAGDPATGTPMQVGRAIVSQHLLASAENYLTPAKVDLLSKASVEACDMADGLKDGLVANPKACNFKPEVLKCTGADGPNCLTAGQIETVKMMYAGLKLPSGEMYTFGFPVGHEGGTTGWQAWTTGRTPATPQPDGSLAFTQQPSGFNLSEQNMRFLALENDDPSFSWKTIKFPQDLPRLKMMSEVLSPSDPDLRPYKNRNGKLIIYHGLSDPAITAYGTMDYYERMAKIVGGQKEAESFARLFIVPGMHHCSGGPGPNTFDELTALENWVEKGVAPTQMIASHSTGGGRGATTPAVIDRTRPLCVYPQMARYTGSGSIDDAANFRCELPR